ncbi:uncharacterized protein [Physcomitrium patens]|uniref:uncharacterized protein isoform X3 n=1 Tax=Physcomitrium patens TaxID=3218 RepID=UPI003CCDABDC
MEKKNSGSSPSMFMNFFGFNSSYMDDSTDLGQENNEIERDNNAEEDDKDDDDNKDNEIKRNSKLDPILQPSTSNGMDFQDENQANFAQTMNHIWLNSDRKQMPAANQPRRARPAKRNHKNENHGNVNHANMNYDLQDLPPENMPNYSKPFNHQNFGPILHQGINMHPAKSMHRPPYQINPNPNFEQQKKLYSSMSNVSKSLGEPNSASVSQQARMSHQPPHNAHAIQFQAEPTNKERQYTFFPKYCGFLDENKDSKHDNAHLIVNDANSHTMFIPSSMNASQKNEIITNSSGPNNPLINQNPQQVMQFPYKDSFRNTLSNSQGTHFDTNNHKNVPYQQQSSLPNQDIVGNPSLMYNPQHVPQEQKQMFNFEFQNPLINHHVNPTQQQQNNFNSSSNLHAPTFHQQRFNPPLVQTIATTDAVDSHDNIHEVESNKNSQKSQNNEDENLEHDLLIKQGIKPNVSYVLSPPAANTPVNPQNTLPTLNITFSPTFHDSPSSLPTTPTPQKGPSLPTGQQNPHPNLNYNPSQNISLHPPQYQNPEKYHNVSPSMFSAEPHLGRKKVQNYSKEYNPTHNEMGSLMTNDNLVNVQRLDCSSACQSQCEAYCNQFEVCCNSIDSHTVSQNCKNKRVSRSKSRWQPQHVQDSDSEDGSTHLSTHKRTLGMLSKKLKSSKYTRKNEIEDLIKNIPMWIQKSIVLPSHQRGFYNITRLLTRHLECDLSFFKCGLAHIFLQDTSASLAVNEFRNSKCLQDFENNCDVVNMLERKTPSCSRKDKGIKE